MEIRILNKDLKWEYVVEGYKSFIWTERYREFGDFEIYLPMEPGLLDHFKMDYYVQIEDSDTLMIIEELKIITDPDDGDMLIVSGRDLSSILERRISGNFNQYTNNDVKIVIAWDSVFVNNISMKGVSETPTTLIRKIPGYESKDPSEYMEDSPEIYEKTIGSNSSTFSFNGKSVVDILNDFLNILDCGFKTVYTPEKSKNYVFYFYFYKGIDRSYQQKENPYVIFSKSFGTLLSSSFTNSKKKYKNAAAGIMTSTLVINKNNRNQNQILFYWGDTYTEFQGLDRREIIFNIDSTNTHEFNSEKNQTENLKALVRMQLGRYKEKKEFEGVGEETPQWQYRKDYFLGDIVQLEDGYGNSGPARITEYTFCDDTSNGFQHYPTFSKV